MIENEKQYKITQERVKKFRIALEEAKTHTGLHPIQREVYVDSISSQIEELEEEIKKYENRLK